MLYAGWKSLHVILIRHLCCNHKEHVELILIVAGVMSDTPYMQQVLLRSCIASLPQAATFASA